MSENNESRCVYCGGTATTDDHVPPKNIFPRPLPSNLVTVRSCETCNCGSSKDDEYFRSVLVFRDGVAESDVGSQVWETVRRSLRRPQAKRFAQSLANSIFDKPVETEHGIFLGTAPAMSIDRERIERVIYRTVRGLYFHHFHRSIPMSDKLVIYHDDIVRQWPSAFTDMIGEIVAVVTRQEHNRMGNDVFEYCFAAVSDHPTASAWALRFYANTYVLAVNLPNDYAEMAEEALALDA